jgi:predicted nucleic acid-binding Zn ribbon protein
MPFSSLQQVLGGFEDHDNWQKRKQFRQLLHCWSEVVGGVVAAQTQPVFIQRQVLQVATSSAAWAQNLAFERQRILEKLNACLPYPITDIRFSTANWRSEKLKQLYSNAAESSILWQDHPSRVSIAPSTQPVSLSPSIQDPQTAFQRWAAIVRDRSRHLPACPVCQCPTPPGELQRWSVCAVCAVKRKG